MTEFKKANYDIVLDEYQAYISNWVKEQGFELIEVQLDVRGEVKESGLVDIIIRTKYNSERMDIEQALNYQAKLTSEIYQITERIKAFKYLGYEAE